MNYLDKERFSHENNLHYSDDKVWFIVDTDVEDVVGEYDSYELALKGFNQRLKGDPDANIGIGWLWENNKCSMQHPDFHKVFNPINIEPEDIKQAV